MAQLDTGGDDKKKKGGKVRSKKNPGSVDLTAMVDLAFLLITFFMLTTTLSKPQSMTLDMPDKDKDEKKKEDDMKVDENIMMTILIDKDNRIEWYMGQFDKPIIPPTTTTYGKDGIRKVLLEQKKIAISKTGDPKKNLIVALKPTKDAVYRNMVDILDEMAIVNPQIYAISELQPQEVKYLENK